MPEPTGGQVIKWTPQKPSLTFGKLADPLPMPPGKAKEFFVDLTVLYGYGDEWSPVPETVELMNEIVREYIATLTEEGCRVAAEQGAKLDYKCFHYLVRHDQPKYKRVTELIAVHKEIRDARSQNLTDEAKLR